jgi:hypothetical protein
VDSDPHLLADCVLTYAYLAGETDHSPASALPQPFFRPPPAESLARPPFIARMLHALACSYVHPKRKRAPRGLGDESHRLRLTMLKCLLLPLAAARAAAPEAAAPGPGAADGAALLAAAFRRLPARTKACWQFQLYAARRWVVGPTSLAERLFGERVWVMAWDFPAGCCTSSAQPNPTPSQASTLPSLNPAQPSPAEAGRRCATVHTPQTPPTRPIQRV